MNGVRTQVAQAMGNVMARNVWEILNFPKMYLLKCNTIVHSAQHSHHSQVQYVYFEFHGKSYVFSLSLQIPIHFLIS